MDRRDCAVPLQTLCKNNTWNTCPFFDHDSYPLDRRQRNNKRKPINFHWNSSSFRRIHSWPLQVYISESNFPRRNQICTTTPSNLQGRHDTSFDCHNGQSHCREKGVCNRLGNLAERTFTFHDPSDPSRDMFNPCERPARSQQHWYSSTARRHRAEPGHQREQPAMDLQLHAAALREYVSLPNR